MLEGKGLLIISTIIAFLPILIWLFFLFRKSEQSKKTIITIFLLGCLTAPALLLLQVFWNKFPQFNIAALIDNNVKSQTLHFIVMFIFFGMMEEIIKMYVLISVDKKTVLIKTINDTIKYSLVSALGFAFTENIYYLTQFWHHISTGNLIGMYAFRSTFTAAAHMIFSGIFGYFYAMGKFSINISKEEHLLSKRKKSTVLLSKLFSIPYSQAFKEAMILKGLFLAMTIHATYNYLLQLGYQIPVIIFVVSTGIYMLYLMKRKAGNLIINTDISNKKRSTLAKKDEEVILELLSMWFKDKRYVDVIHICERLLERDPDNQIVKLFKAKSMDKMDNSNPYKQIINSVIKTQDELDLQSKNKLSKYIQEKEMYEKVKKMIKKQIEKEGKKYKDIEKERIENIKKQFKKNDKTNTKKQKQDYLENFTEGESFKLD